MSTLVIVFRFIMWVSGLLCWCWWNWILVVVMIMRVMISLIVILVWLSGLLLMVLDLCSFISISFVSSWVCVFYICEVE